MKDKNLYSPGYYAKKKGVHPSRITFLRSFLKGVKIDDNTKMLIEDCTENDVLFSNPSALRGRKKTNY